MSWKWTMTSCDQYATTQNPENTICLTAGDNKLKINLFIQTESSRTLKGMLCFVLIKSEVVIFFDIQCKKAENLVKCTFTRSFCSKNLLSGLQYVDSILWDHKYTTEIKAGPKNFTLSRSFPMPECIVTN